MQDIHLLVADLVGIEGDHRLHRHQAEQLHQMVLHHVAQRPGMIVIAAAMLDAHGLGDGDRHIIDVAPVPERLEQRIGKTEGEDVLHRLLAEIVVDAENLRPPRSWRRGCRSGRVPIPDRSRSASRSRCARIPGRAPGRPGRGGAESRRTSTVASPCRRCDGSSRPIAFRTWRTGCRARHRSLVF